MRKNEHMFEKKTDNLCDFGFLSFGHSIVLIAYLSKWLWFLSFLVGFFLWLVPLFFLRKITMCSTEKNEKLEN